MPRRQGEGPGEFPMRVYLLPSVAVLTLTVGTLVAWSQPIVELPAPTRLRFADFGNLQMQGTASCATSCHNGDVPGYRGREFALALQRGDGRHFLDRHADAFSVLYETRSRRIEQNFRGLVSIEQAHPEKDVLCLRCHVHPNVDAQPTRRTDGVRQFRLEDGVSCEACHGPADRWLAEHFRPGWKALSGQQKFSRGMVDTASVESRAQICVDCHVGAAGMEVNHDLIAAGHPRLNFEFNSFHTFLHRHWDPARDIDSSRDPRGRTDFEARAWAVGQLASSRAALELLADRAGHVGSGGAAWPELAEYDCFACHHDLREKAWRQADGRQEVLPGTLRWNGWYFSQLPRALSALSGTSGNGLREEISEMRSFMEKRGGKRSEVAERARNLAARLGRELDKARKRSIEIIPLQATFNEVLSERDDATDVTWESATQSYLALVALGKSARLMRQPLDDANLRDLRGLLLFPNLYNSPRDFSPGEAKKHLQELRKRSQP